MLVFCLFNSTLIIGHSKDFKIFKINLDQHLSICLFVNNNRIKGYSIYWVIVLEFLIFKKYGEIYLYLTTQYHPWVKL